MSNTMPEGYIPRPGKDQTLEAYISEELSKHNLTFNDVLNNEEMMAELSKDDAFMKLKAEFENKDKPEVVEASSNKKEEKVSEPKVEEKKDPEPEKDAPALVVEEVVMDDDDADEVEKPTMEAPKSTVAKLTETQFRIDSSNLMSKIDFTIAYDKLMTVDSFGVEDLVTKSPFYATRLDKPRHMRMDEFCNEFIEPAIPSALGHPNSEGYTDMVGFDWEKNQYLNLYEELGRRSVEAIELDDDANAGDVIIGGVTSLSMIKQVNAIVHDAILPKGRLAYIMAQMRAARCLQFTRVANGQEATPEDKLQAYMDAYMNPTYTRALRIRTPEPRVVTYNKAIDYVMYRLTLNADNDFISPMVQISDSIDVGRGVRSRSYQAATTVMSVIASSHRNLERPMTSARAPAKVITAFTDLVAPPAAEAMQKLGSYCLGGRRAELTVDMTDPILQSTDSVLAPIAAAANLILLDTNRLGNDIKRTLVYRMLSPFYGTGTRAEVDRINFNNIPRIVLTPIPDRRGLHGRLANFIRRQLTKPAYGRMDRNDSRIWRADIQTTPMLPFVPAGGMTPLSMHIGDERLENQAYAPQANELKVSLMDFVKMFDLMHARQGKETYLSSQFSAILTNESSYLYNSISMVMRTMIRGWESLDLLPPLDGAVPGALEMDRTEAFVLPFTGAVSFICYGIEDDGLEYVPWEQRKEIPMPSSFPMLLDMEIRVANELLLEAADPAGRFTRSDMLINQDEFINMAEFIMKKYLTSIDGGEFGTRYRLHWYLFEGIRIHNRTLQTPGIEDLKVARRILDGVKYPEDIATAVYIKIYESVNPIDLVNPDPQRSDYQVYMEEIPADDEILEIKDIVTYRREDGGEDFNFTPYLHSGETFNLDLIRKLAKSIPGDHRYVKVPTKVTVKPVELLDNVDVIAEDFTVALKFKKGVNEMRFEASDIPLYYRWDKFNGRSQLTLDVRVFPDTNVLLDHVMESDPRMGYAPQVLNDGTVGWVSTLSGNVYLEERKVCRREEEVLKSGIDLLIDPYGV
ncbi:VP3 [Micromonas pusilla reovirus]|uniref:Major inner capsid protein VP3 n=1 Tax=Micromonas pusilla reovirus (isolate Netherlands/2005) TaxID=649596 RepID=CAPSD_MPRVN|nr:VP3 [Micromonas pusilla reovirus]Q1I0U9.1 RecName: Full=Major inner capsid protein VP3 [Micromonas pusilla reovirus (isolate Netherlands)]AAZ94043.1 VP3 [Micromonas pusilla reovirus]